MAEKLSVDVTGKSKYEVAEHMAQTILITIEGKSWKKINRQEYLAAVYHSIRTLSGVEPD
jgi:hypothetical protein